MVTEESRDLAADWILRHEGLRLRPYVDTVGKTTIGVGRNLTDCGISREEALFLFRNDLEKAVALVENRFGPYLEAMGPRRVAVLIDMAFNLGNKLLSFNKFREAIKAGNYSEAANQMLKSRWAEQVGARARFLASVMRGEGSVVK